MSAYAIVMPLLDLHWLHLCVVFQSNGVFESSRVQLLNVRHVESLRLEMFGGVLNLDVNSACLEF